MKRFGGRDCTKNIFFGWTLKYFALKFVYKFSLKIKLSNFTTSKYGYDARHLVQLAKEIVQHPVKAGTDRSIVECHQFSGRHSEFLSPKSNL